MSPTRFLVAVVCAALGCSVRPGLANAPALGAVPPGNGRQHDVVTNGHDSCERRGAGSPLRGHWPPCGNEAGPQTGAQTQVTPPPPNSSEPPPLYTRWPHCSSSNLLEASYTLRDATEMRAYFSRRVWSTTCVDWMQALSPPRRSAPRTGKSGSE
jgi:hypothetical protein